MKTSQEALPIYLSCEVDMEDACMHTQLCTAQTNIFFFPLVHVRTYYFLKGKKLTFDSVLVFSIAVKTNI